MKGKYKYDVAFSFAVEDMEIADSIKEELERLSVKCYFFEEKRTPGNNLKRKSWKIYGKQSRYALVLISEHYPNKKWSKEEWEIILGVQRDWDYIIPLRLDDTLLEGLHSNTEYITWEGNPSHTAISIFSTLRPKKKGQSKKSLPTKHPKNGITIHAGNNAGIVKGSETNNHYY